MCSREVPLCSVECFLGSFVFCLFGFACLHCAASVSTAAARRREMSWWKGLCTLPPPPSGEHLHSLPVMFARTAHTGLDLNHKSETRCSMFPLAGDLQNGRLDSQPCLALFFVQRFAGWLLGGYGSFCVERSIKFSSNVARVTVIGTFNHSFSSLIPSQSLVTLPLPLLCDGYDSSEA